MSAATNVRCRAPSDSGGLGPADGFHAEQHRQRQVGVGQGRRQRGQTAGLRRERRVACSVGRVPGAAPLLERQRAGHEGQRRRRRPRRRSARRSRRRAADLPSPRRPRPRRGSPRGTPARAAFGSAGWPRSQSSASSRRAPRYSSPSSRPAPSQLRAASVRWRWTRRPSRSASSQPRSRGHWRIRASWATSTVGSRLAGSRSKLSSRARAEPVDHGPGRRRSSPSSETAHPPPGVLGALAEHDEAAEQPAQRRPLLGRRAPR